MRVVAGEARGIRLATPAGAAVRPTGDRVREATFNALGSMNAIAEANFVDLFAGSGAMGIEALSRGARHATFVDASRQSVELISENLTLTRLEPRSTVINRDVITWLGAVDSTEFDVAIADPPYEFDGWLDLTASLEVPVLVIESDREVVLADRYELRRERRYGSTVVSIAALQESDT